MLLSHIIFGIQSYFCCVNFRMKCNPFYIYGYTLYIYHSLRYITYEEIEFRVYSVWTKNISSLYFSKAQIQTVRRPRPKFDKTSGFPLTRISQRNYFICSTIMPSVLTSTDKQLSLNSLQQIYETINLSASQNRFRSSNIFIIRL